VPKKVAGGRVQGGRVQGKDKLLRSFADEDPFIGVDSREGDTVQVGLL
jgi:hypothetical protein